MIAESIKGPTVFRYLGVQGTLHLLLRSRPKDSEPSSSYIFAN